MTRPTFRSQLGMDDPDLLLEMNQALHSASLDEGEDEVVIERNAFEKDEIVEACRIDLDFLAAMAMPDVYKYGFSSTHKVAWQILTGGILDGSKKFLQLALGIPRGHAKTTLIKLFILWCILFTNRKFFLVTCSIETHAINIIADVARMLQEPNIISVFGDYRSGLETDTKQLKKFNFRERDIVIFGIGAGGAVRGSNLNNERPDVIIMDDIQTREDAQSPIISKDLMDWMVGTLMKSKSQTRCLFLFAGNMFPTPHSILKQLKTNSTWIKFISGGILADGKALWPEHRPLPDLLEELHNDMAMGRAHIFFAEVMNDTEVGINSQVDYSRFPPWKWCSYDVPQGKFIIIDPSQGKGKDNDVIMRCEVYDGVIGIRAIIEEGFSPKNLILRALIEAIQSGTYVIAIESMAYQSTLLFWFEEVCKDHGISGISFLPIYTNTISKNSRIQKIVQAMQATNELVLHPDVRSLVQAQIKDWNPLKRDNVDDILDAASNAPKVLADYAMDILTPSNLMVIETDRAKVQEDNHAF
jgi:hypothetical protein